MHSFDYENGSLHCEGVDIASIAKQFGTPTYVYSKATLSDHYTRLDQAMAPVDHMVCYAVKANSNLAVINTLAKLGSGFDIVSAGELFRVIKAGGDPRRCTFAGVGKTVDELRYALENDIYSINVESLAELETINQVAGDMGKVAPVALRVNPNVDAKTHKYISTGKSENKFGIDFSRIEAAYADAAERLPNVKLHGLQMHIGSQLTSVDPFIEAVKKVAPLAAKLKETYGIEFFSIGGGVGIVYHETLPSGHPDWWTNDSPSASPLTIDRYAAAILPELKNLGLRILLEPGRLIAGNAGALVTKVLYTKKGDAKTFQIVDSGMGDLIRPALYEGHHDIVPVAEPTTDEKETIDVVGPICETGDFFVQNADLPKLEQGNLIALLSAGAYGFTMASNYNSRPLPAEVMVDGEQVHLIRKRQTLDDLIAGESLLP
ncbi:diaminopimelate decarboxylase [Sulfuriroseicoccus oceanibius]|uniref:Diaminopimelate decarboxylase n=1 Tax=Sulfuriroseicoccus oceanibius TaxID=2707525 RepID=A0A6B3LC10_9BACT|nr:diaminopimelate decarboxylase [Sulfuriroseicoccus oceanibius]QQL45929.1 diaminopimelate decarboxylase [Sulfuriroseicoccus oceanibius]